MPKTTVSYRRGRTSLRVPDDVLRSIDNCLGSGAEPKSRNSWITAAIQEKLVRETQAAYPSNQPREPAFPFYEFFAGGGMARMGLGKKWTCTFANDFDKKKAQAYAINWGDDHLSNRDIQTLTADRLPGTPRLAWASFPCQDLSLAGNGAGLRGQKSGTFWAFWNLIKQLGREKRAPDIIVLENVAGAITSDQGRDFDAIVQALAAERYHFGPLVIDAALFLPQSRPRLFIVATRDDLAINPALAGSGPERPFHPESLEDAFDRAPAGLRQCWRWWKLPQPPQRKSVLCDLIETEPTGVNWHSPAETQNLLHMMSPVNRRKIEAAQLSGARRVGTLYRRTRKGVQCAEVRFDETAGCLRTPGGGSSRQTLVIVEKDSIRSRLLSPREAARLMGLPDSYKLPGNYNDAYHLAGDGLVVPVVHHLAQYLLTPLAEQASRARHVAA